MWCAPARPGLAVNRSKFLTIHSAHDPVTIAIFSDGVFHATSNICPNLVMGDPAHHHHMVNSRLTSVSVK